MTQPRSKLFYPSDTEDAHAMIAACDNRAVVSHDGRLWRITEWECLPPDGQRIVCHLEEVLTER